MDGEYCARYYFSVSSSSCSVATCSSKTHSISSSMSWGIDVSCDACEALDTKDVKVCFTEGKSRHSWFQGLGAVARALKPCYLTRPTFPLR